MTRKICLLLCLAMLMTLTVGTVTQSGANEDKTVFQFMLWGNPNYEDANYMIESVETAFPELKGKYGWDLISAGSGNDDVTQKLRLMMTANEQMPDMVQFNRNAVPEFAEIGFCRDLTDAYAPYMDELLPGALELVSYKDQVIAFPYELKCKLWFYRADLFEEAGIDPAAIITTDDFIAAGHKLKETFPDSYIWNLGSDIAGYNAHMVLSGNGARFTDDNNNYIIDTDPGVRLYIEDIMKIKDSGVTIEINDWTPDWEQGFADGTIASTPLANWLKFFLPNYAPEQAGLWAVAQWPEIGGCPGGQGSENGGSMFVVPNNAGQGDEIIEFLSMLMFDKTASLKWFELKGVTPLTKSAINDPAVQKPDKFFGVSLMREEAVAYEKIKIFDYSPSSTLEFDIFNTYVSMIGRHEISIDDALAQCQADMISQIGDPWQ